MTCPPGLGSQQQCVDRWQISSGENLRVRYFVLPFDAQDLVKGKVGHVEMFELPTVSPIDGPHFAAVQEGRKHCCSVDLQLCFEADPSAFPNIGMQSELALVILQFTSASKGCLF